MGPPRSGLAPPTLHPSGSACAVLRREDLRRAELRPCEHFPQALERGVADRAVGTERQQATGARELPVTPERVRAALGRAKRRA